MIMWAQVGSGMHGASVTTQDDRDEMGLRLGTCFIGSELSWRLVTSRQAETT
jgi:hypothetical protein